MKRLLSLLLPPLLLPRRAPLVVPVVVVVRVLLDYHSSSCPSGPWGPGGGYWGYARGRKRARNRTGGQKARWGRRQG